MTDIMSESVLGKIVTVTMDRPLGFVHPEHKSMVYPVNYGYIEGITGGDGEEQDAYVIGETEALDSFSGKVIAVVHRLDDVEDKWIVASPECRFSEQEIRQQIYFQEQYFTITLECCRENIPM